MADLKDYFPWPKKLPPIQQLIKDIRIVNPRDDNAFHDIIQRSLAMGVDEKLLRRKFSCDKPTVTRWKNGKNFPHPAMRPHVYKWLVECLIEF